MLTTMLLKSDYHEPEDEVNAKWASPMNRGGKAPSHALLKRFVKAGGVPVLIDMLVQCHDDPMIQGNLCMCMMGLLLRGDDSEQVRQN